MMKYTYKYYEYWVQNKYPPGSQGNITTDICSEFLSSFCGISFLGRMKKKNANCLFIRVSVFPGSIQRICLLIANMVIIPAIA